MNPNPENFFFPTIPLPVPIYLVQYTALASVTDAQIPKRCLQYLQCSLWMVGHPRN